jgi:hypothetical protein
MLTAPSMKLFSALTTLALCGFLVAVFTAQHGCASDCGAHCPATSAYIGSIDDTQLDVDFDVYGPACPPRSAAVCTGDQSSTTCTHTTIAGQSPGPCDVLVAFNPYTDGRQWEVVHLQFAEPYSAPGTCCGGYPVIGTSTYIIPDHPSQGGVYAYGDGGAKFYDAITFVTDGGADGAPDGGADAAPDALPGG